MKPIIGITMGDAAGIGPEVSLKALLNSTVFENSHCILMGSASVWQQAAKQISFSKKLVQIKTPVEATGLNREISILECASLDISEYELGKPTKATGRAAGLTLEKAIELANQKQIGAIVTAPLQKEVLNQAGYHFPGHTEMLKKLSGAPDVVMLMYSEKLSTALVTTHSPLSQVPKLLSKEKINFVIRLTYAFLQKLGKSPIRIGVAALNPHAGEGGLFGREEIEIIQPVIDEAQKSGLPVFGPYPPDTIYYNALKRDFDCVISMYHDQGLIPFKLVAFDEGVNVTLGLPFPRTSPDHGTALDIAGKNCANPNSMVEAICLAIRLCVGKDI